MICQVISTFRPTIGGAQIATEHLCHDLDSAGVPSIVLTRCFRGLPRFEVVNGVRVHRLGMRSRGKLGAATFALHAVWLLATRLRHARIVHVQNTDAPLVAGLAARILLRRRLVATVHGESKLAAHARTAPGRLRLRLLSRFVDAHTALTPRVAHELHARGVPTRRIHSIPNAVDAARYRPPTPQERRRARERLDLPTEATIYTCIGRLVSGKRIDLILRAWHRLPPRDRPRRLLIVGDGPDRPRLERLAAELRLGDVRFEGESPDVVDHLRAADIYVSASPSEGLSLALLEAMAAGLAVVAARIPGNEAVLRHGVDGLLVPVHDVAALARALDRLGASDPLARRLRRQARERIRRQHSRQRIAKLYLQLYGTLAPVPRNSS